MTDELVVHTFALLEVQTTSRQAVVTGTTFALGISQANAGRSRQQNYNRGQTGRRRRSGMVEGAGAGSGRP